MFVVCGEALWDLYATERRDGLSFDARIGGSPFNVAVGMARLGAPASLFTKVSTDRLGERLCAALAREGVRTDSLKRSPRLTTLSLVDVDEAGSPAYTFYGEGAADRAIDASDLPRLGDEVWGLHLGSFSLVTNPTGTSLLALARAESRSRLITLDPNVRLAVEPDRGLWRDRISALLPHCHVVKVSAEDIGLLFPDEAWKSVIERWASAGPALVVVTKGGDGAEAHGRFGCVSVPARPVEVVDTVGAGDSFMAALIAGLYERKIKTRQQLADLRADRVPELLDFACRAAAITCSRRGADLPTRAELGRVAAAGA